MLRWSVLLAFMLLLAFGSSVGHARKLVVFGHGGGPLQGWFSLKIVDFHMEHGQVFTLSNGRKPIPLFERIPLFQRQPSRLQDLDISSLNGVPQSFMCDTCLDISTFVEQVLTDPDTMGNVLDYVNGSFCKALSGLQEECIGLAEMYVPELVEMLQVYAAPDKLCGETKLCPSSAMLLLDDARTCKMCTDFTTEALTYIQDNETETQILDALHSQCSKLGEFSSRCNTLIDTYAPLYIQEVDSVTPEQLCQKVGFCSSRSIKDPSHCATCEMAVYQLKAKLRNPLVQEKMLEMLLDGCSKVPGHVDQCKEIITQYGPFILANIDTYVDAETICTEIHACDSTKKLSDDVLIQLPTARASISNQ